MTQRNDANQQSQPKVNNPPTNLHVRAREVNGQIEWDLDDKSPPDQGKISVDLLPDSGEHEIVIHLVATQGLKIDWKTSDPIWVSEGTACPPPEGICSDQIRDVTCVGNKLSFKDANDGAPRTLTYQLNFVGAGPCDPEIRNGGGGNSV